ncbi:glycosyltransferase [Sphingobacterium sp. Lzh-3]|uniref:glycosyltransferase n=1 Tax=Sphingobacterium sp. Lzh-3 TaxID=3382150 RepID=UPI00398CEDA3
MITASIVLFKQTYAEIESLLNGLNQSGINNLFIVDNSPFNTIEKEIIGNHPNIQYIHQAHNPGFGAAHNIAFKKAMSIGSQYHFVVNPDVLLKDNVVFSLVDFLKNNPEVGMVMPQILNTDGTIQYLPKFLPSPISFYKRILYRKFKLFSSFVAKYELRNVAPDLTYDTPVISGCFTLFRVSALQEIGLYDDRFFMYLEDWDISRRMNAKYRTVYYPKAAIVHGYAAGSSKSYGLFKVHVRSIRAYFGKWGWFFDSERARLNERTRKQFK